MARVLAGLFCLAGALGWCVATAHAVSLFEYDSICYSNCTAIGLDSGDAVSASIGFDDGVVVGLGTADGDDIVSFEATFGNAIFGMPSLSLESVSVIFDASANAATSFRFVANSSGDDPGFSFDEDFWITGPSATEVTTGGAGSLTLVPPAAHEVPALLPWFHLALVASLIGVAVGMWRWRAA